MRRRSAEAGAAYSALIAERHDLEARDRAAYAQAIAAGKPDPGSKALEAHDRKLAAAKRDSEALRLAADNAESAVVALVERHRGTWQRQAHNEVAKRRAHLREAVAAWEQARHAVNAAYALAVWLADPHRSYKERQPAIEGLASLADVAGALERDATPPIADESAEAA